MNLFTPHFSTYMKTQKRNFQKLDLNKIWIDYFFGNGIRLKIIASKSKTVKPCSDERQNGFKLFKTKAK